MGRVHTPLLHVRSHRGVVVDLVVVLAHLGSGSQHQVFSGQSPLSFEVGRWCQTSSQSSRKTAFAQRTSRCCARLTCTGSSGFSPHSSDADDTPSGAGRVVCSQRLVLIAAQTCTLSDGGGCDASPGPVEG